MPNKNQVKLELFKKLENFEKKLDQINGVIFGNPNKEEGLIARIVKLETAVRNNTKLTWAVLGVIIMSAVALLFK